MWFIGVEVEQETSAPLLKKILDPPLYSVNITISSLLYIRNSIKVALWSSVIGQYTEVTAVICLSDCQTIGSQYAIANTQYNPFIESLI